MIQYKAPENGKEKYIPLKGYLMLVRKQYTEINEEDIRFLVGLPRNLPDVKGHPVILTYGPYGLYFKYNGRNYSCPRKLSKLIIEGQPYNEDDVAKALEYVHKEKSDEVPTIETTLKPSKATKQSKTAKPRVKISATKTSKKSK